jgi:hypothetical protein
MFSEYEDNKEITKEDFNSMMARDVTEEYGLTQCPHCALAGTDDPALKKKILMENAAAFAVARQSPMGGFKIFPKAHKASYWELTLGEKEAMDIIAHQMRYMAEEEDPRITEWVVGFIRDGSYHQHMYMVPVVGGGKE